MSDKTHYFIRPKRQKTHHTHSELLDLPSPSLSGSPFTPLFNGKEPPQNVDQRYSSYQAAWKRQLERIDNIMNNANIDLFINLASFIESPTPLLPLSKHSISTRSRQLQVAYLQLSTNTANNLRILQEFSNYMGKKKCHIISLNSKACTNIKSSLREVVRQFVGAEHVISGHVNYDLDIIAAQYADTAGTPDTDDTADTADTADTPLVVILQDTNSINNHVVNQLIRVLHSYSEKIPLRVIMGLSSSNVSSWINANLSNENRILISGIKFKCTDNKSLGYRVMDDLLLNLEPGSLLVSQHLATVLHNRFENANNSIDTLVSQIKLCYMIFYYSNPLSVLRTDDTERLSLCESGPMYLDALRKLPSFKAFIERSIYHGDVDADTITSYLTDNNGLLGLYDNSVAQLGEYKRDLAKSLENHRPGEARFKGFRALVAKSDPLTDVPFHELFMLSGGPINDNFIFQENYENLMTTLVRPNLRYVIEAGLDDCTQYLHSVLTGADRNRAFNAPTLSILFRVYKEAPVAINIYDFFLAFRSSLDKNALTSALGLGELDEKEWDEVSYSWFIQNCFELVMMGLLKEKPKGDYLEKAVWKSV